MCNAFVNCLPLAAGAAAKPAQLRRWPLGRPQMLRSRNFAIRYFDRLRCRVIPPHLTFPYHLNQNTERSNFCD